MTNRCLITKKKVKDYTQIDGLIRYIVEVNDVEFTLIFSENVNTHQILTEETTHIFYAWLWNNIWPFYQDTIITKELLTRTLRQLSYPKDFYSYLDFFILNFYNHGGKELKTWSLLNGNYLSAFAHDLEEFNRVILAGERKLYFERILPKLEGLPPEIRLTEEGIKYAEQLSYEIDYFQTPISNRILAGKTIYIGYVEADKEWGGIVQEILQRNGASIRFQSQGINQQNSYYLSNVENEIIESDFAILLKSKNSDLVRVWGDLLGKLAFQEDYNLKQKPSFMVFFIDDSNYDQYQVLNEREGRLRDIRIIPMLHKTIREIGSILGRRNPTIESKNSVETSTSLPNINISQLHDKIFNHLKEWNEENDNNDNNDSSNNYFYIRTREDERFKIGYWFPGDENYIAVSFWTGGDSLNKTSNIYINFDINKKVVTANIVARDSDNKKKYFELLVQKLNGYTKSNKLDIWSKTISNSFDSIENALNEFINNDKLIIDETLKSTLEDANNPDRFLLEDEFSSKFGFISEEQFQKLKSRVETSKKKMEAARPYSVTIPCSLSSIKIKSFNGIINSELTNLPSNAKWIFLTGENGYGKSSVLHAIALGLTNYPENINYFNSETEISIGYNFYDTLKLNHSGLNFKSEEEYLNGKLIAYGPIRLNAQSISSENQESKNSSNVYNLFNRDGLLKNINYLILKSYFKTNKTEFQSIKKAILEILDHRITDIQIDSNAQVKYLEADNSGNALILNNWESLATGFQNLLNLTGDIIYRFAKEFPDKEPKDYEGIVLIDELENHLHPHFQKRLPFLLSNVFPKIQFIASIHSPIPLLGAPLNSVILTVERTREEGIMIKRVDTEIKISNLLPNSILSSPIFGFKEITSINHEKGKDKLTTLDFYDDIVSHQEKKNKLREIAKKMMDNNDK